MPFLDFPKFKELSAIIVILVIKSLHKAKFLVSLDTIKKASHCVRPFYLDGKSSHQ